MGSPAYVEPCNLLLDVILKHVAETFLVSIGQLADLALKQFFVEHLCDTDAASAYATKLDPMPMMPFPRTHIGTYRPWCCKQVRCLGRSCRSCAHRAKSSTSVYTRNDTLFQQMYGTNLHFLQTIHRTVKV